MPRGVRLEGDSGPAEAADGGGGGEAGSTVPLGDRKRTLDPRFEGDAGGVLEDSDELFVRNKGMDGRRKRKEWGQRVSLADLVCRRLDLNHRRAWPRKLI